MPQWWFNLIRIQFRPLWIMTPIKTPRMNRINDLEGLGKHVVLRTNAEAGKADVNKTKQSGVMTNNMPPKKIEYVFFRGTCRFETVW